MTKLYHVTHKKNIPSIMEEGLVPELSDYTVKIWMNKNYGKIRSKIDPYDLAFEDDRYLDEYAIEEYIREQFMNKMSPIIFATRKEHLSEVFKSYQNRVRVGKENLAVIEIKDDPFCSGLFEPRYVNADYDWVSENHIPPRCLDVIEEKILENDTT